MGEIVKKYLNSSNKLVDEVVGYVKGCPRDENHKNFFDHLMVVVPTAEGGRNLRLALAKEVPERAIFPPRVVQPSHLLKPADANVRPVSDVELQAVFLAFIASMKGEIKDREFWNLLFNPGFLDDARALLGFLDQLNEIWHALAGKGLLMQDVLKNEKAVEVLTNAVGSELDRWQQLGDFEKQFFAFLEAKGLYHYAKVVQLAVENPALPPEGVTEVILPALVDPIQALYPVLEKWQVSRPDLKLTVLIHADASDADKFDAWGRPKADKWSNVVLEKLRTEDIFRSATNQALGEKLADEFLELKDKPLPALGLIDAGTFSDVQAALMSHDQAVHNPERHALNVSSLGAIVDLLMSVWGKFAESRALEWKDIAGLLRQYDVMNFVAPAGGGPDRAKILEEMDNFANKFLPVMRPTDTQLAFKDDHTSFTNLSAAIRKLETLFDTGLDLSDFVGAALRKLYAHPIDSREFHAAAAALRNLLQELKGEAFQALPKKEQLLIAREAVAKANYQLDPENANVIKTLGWLELAWTSKAQIALVGFHEGCVPDALIGHAFIPDSLREALGLTSNKQRFARDVYLLKELLASRKENDVKFFVALANAAGDIQKPSRLLFLCEDKELPIRVRHLFDEIPSEEKGEKQPPELSYRLKKSDLTAEVQKRSRGRVSPSAIDTYIKCPFTYLLQRVLYLKGYKIEKEMPANEFGILAHMVLQEYTERQIERTKASQPQLMREDLIRDELLSCFDKCAALYGKTLTANTALQLNSLKSRLLDFAPIQAQWVAEGWNACAAEYKVLDPDAFEVDGQKIAMKGFIDRIDCREKNGEKEYRIIDYKTWDSNDTADSHVFASSAAENAFADEMGYWHEKLSPRQRSARRFLSVQLPLYARSFERLEKCKVVEMCYLLLGAGESEIAVRLGVGDRLCNLMDVKDKAVETAQRAVEGIVRGEFWHFGPGEGWKMYDFARYFKGMKSENWEVQ